MWIRKGKLPDDGVDKIDWLSGVNHYFAQHGNWRVVFRFQEGEVSDVDLIDYH